MINETQAKSVLRRRKKIDSWFLSHYGANLYRGCSHNCVYCDGRTEKYRVEGEFGKDISVKTNAAKLLDRELNPARKRKPMPQSFVLVGSGVCDTYQPAEKKYMLTRQMLELCLKYKYPVHILTKSTLVERDLDIIKEINAQNKAIVSFSFSSANDKISRLFEPGVPSPSRRFETIKKIKQAGISCGMFLMPVIPLVTDTPQMIEQTLTKAKEAGIDFVIFGTMTLKTGRQKDYFMNVLNKNLPKLVPLYNRIYSKESKWGEASYKYNNYAHEIFNKAAISHKIPQRIPPHIYQKIISRNDLIIVILEQLDYLLRLNNKKSSYGYAAYSLSNIKDSIENLSYDKLLKIKGIDTTTAKIIQEITETGKCVYYENLIYNKQG